MYLIVLLAYTVLTVVNGKDTVSTIAFTAALSQSQTVVGKQVVVYDRIITNHGLGYDNETGIFTAPVEGLFIFHLHLLNIKNEEAWLELYHNDNLIVSAYAQAMTLYDAAGNSVILSLLAGDRVTIRAHRLSGLLGRPNELCTTFSGQYVGARS